MKRVISIKALVLISIMVSVPVLSIQFLNADESTLVFSDHFDGSAIDSTKWNVEYNTNMSGYPAYGGLASTSNSYITLSSNGSGFPCITSKVNPFPSIGDFTLEFDLTYASISDWGIGFWISDGPFIVKDDNSGSNLILYVWANNLDYDTTMISFQLLGVEVKRTLVYGWEPSAANKVLRLDYSGGLYTLSINGIEVASEFSQVRPDTIGFGHPPAYYIPFSPTHVASVMGGWSSLKIDYIKALSTPIASSPSQTPRPSSTPTPTLTPTLTPNPTPTPELKTSKLVFTCETSNIQSTFKVQINGKLNSEENNPIPKADILLSYSVTNGDTWINLTSVNTDNTGSFSVVWMPSVTGNYQVKATWPGNSTHLKIKEIVNFAVTPYAEQSVFSVSSNSTLSAFTFNSTKNELSFSVTGALDTTGYVNVYIPKSLILDISFLKVYLDGTQLSFTNESQEDSWIIHFIYYHSTHTINIDLGSEQTNPSDQSEPLSIIYYAVPLAIIVAIIAILALTLVKKMPKK